MGTPKKLVRKNIYNHKYFLDRDKGQQCVAFSVAKFLKDQKINKVVDVGCGSGWLVKYLIDSGFKTYGCDSSKEAINIAKKKVKPSLITKACASKLPYKDCSFDAVLGISIIEHLNQKEVNQFFKESARILKKNGWLFLVTPNYATPLRILMGEKWGGYWDPTHINFYTPWSLKKVLQKNNYFGFKVTFSYDKDIPFDWGFPPIFFKFPKFIKNILNYLIVSTPLYYLRHSFWMAAQRK
ncbi:MAG: class I SAM-dependent methyltransferase [bacterium]|nr:class I SAM-dependent methyltransferase [bacterium]